MNKNSTARLKLSHKLFALYWTAFQGWTATAQNWNKSLTHFKHRAARTMEEKQGLLFLFLSVGMRSKVIHAIFDLFCRGRPRPNLYNHGQLVLFLFKDKLGFYFKPFNDEVQEIEVKEKICTKETKAIGALKQSWVAPHITQWHNLSTYCNFLSLVNCQLFAVSCLEIVHDANSSQAFFGWTAKY